MELIKRLAHACAVISVFAVVVPSVGRASAPGERPMTAQEFWQALYVHEKLAIQAYRANNRRPVVAWRGEQLFALQHKAALPMRYGVCQQAARTLSMMVTSYAMPGGVGQVALDWHHLAPRYQSERMRCLLQLDLDEDTVALPWWFGR